MSTKKSPWDQSPVPARTQESVFGVGSNLNDALAHIPAHRTIQSEINEMYEATSPVVIPRIVSVPAGSDIIIYSKNFAPSLLTELEVLVTSIEALTPVNSQADVESQNSLLKNASRFCKKFEDERKAMGEPLKEVTDELMQIQKSTLSEIIELIADKNTEIVNFQKAEAKRAAEKAAQIQKERDAEILAAQNENKRKQDILNLINQFETNTLNVINGATIETIDGIINTYTGFKVKESTYMEYMPQILSLQKDLQFKLMYRKEDLQKLADLEKTNKLQADQLRLQQEQQAARDKEAATQRAATQAAEADEQAQSDIANTVMQSELKTSSMPIQKNVMKKWVFDADNVDMAALPLEYHTFDAVKIQAAITAGARNIPGVVIEERISNVKR